MTYKPQKPVEVMCVDAHGLALYLAQGWRQTLQSGYPVTFTGVSGRQTYVSRETPK